MAKVISVVSGYKGGTGKSTVAALVSYKLSLHSGSVLLLDLGGGGSTLLTTGLSQTRFSIEDYLSGLADWSQVLVRAPASSRLFVAPSKTPLVNTQKATNLEELLEAARSAAAYVVVDFPPNPAEEAERLLSHSDKVLVVSTPSWITFSSLKSWVSSRAARLSDAQLVGLLNMYSPLVGGWRKAMLGLVERVVTLSFDAALLFTHAKTIAEALGCASRRTRRDAESILSLMIE